MRKNKLEMISALNDFPLSSLGDLIGVIVWLYST